MLVVVKFLVQITKVLITTVNHHHHHYHHHHHHYYYYYYFSIQMKGIYHDYFSYLMDERLTARKMAREFWNELDDMLPFGGSLQQEVPIWPWATKIVVSTAVVQWFPLADHTLCSVQKWETLNLKQPCKVNLCFSCIFVSHWKRSGWVRGRSRIVLRRGAPLRNGVTDWWRKQILIQNTSCVRKPQVTSRAGEHPCTLPLSLPLWVVSQSSIPP